MAEPRPEGSSVPVDPARVIRISEMIRALLDELRAAEPDAAGRDRVRASVESALPGLRAAVTPDLAAELDRLVAPFAGDDAPSGPELRIVHAQLAGWLEGLWDGIRLSDTMDAVSARHGAGEGEDPGPGRDRPGP